MKVRARISKTNRFREVTLRRDPNTNDSLLYNPTPAYLHVGRATVSGLARETDFDSWVFVPTGKYKNKVYK